MAATAVSALLAEIIAEVRARRPQRPALVGVAGAQGSGKSFQCSAFAALSNATVAHFSLDDVYGSRADRKELAAMIHPLFATRGPPGTHDLNLAIATLVWLSSAAPEARTHLPRFDKFRDEPLPEEEWPVFIGRPEAVLIDGWCLGALPPEDGPPLNALEKLDSDGLWRNAQRMILANEYQSFFDRFDAIIYLQAPNFEIVRRWRGEQEEAMLGRAMTAEESAALDRFIMHYERITRAMLAGGHRAGWIVQLDENRNVLGIEQR
jgi:D-glycerate 3-kinase